LLKSTRRPQTLTLTLILTVFLCLTGSLSVFAGEGNGSGGGKQTPLTLESSNPSDGQKEVKLPVEIKLTFSKNVVNMAVRDNNKKAFKLSSDDGKVIPVEVIMADDQIEPDKNQDVMLKPTQDLKAGTAYQVTIAPQIQSKSGVSLGKEAVLNFTTVGTNPVPTTSTSTAGPAEKTKDGLSSKAILFGVGTVIVLVIGFAYYKRKR